MNTLPRLLTLILLGSCFLVGPIHLGAQDKKDDDPFKVKKKTTDNPADKDKTKPRDDDPFKLKKKPPEKKDDKNKVPPPEEWPTFKDTYSAKIVRVNGELLNEFTIEVQVVDPLKYAKFQQWVEQQVFNINSAKTEKEAFDRTLEYQRELPARQADVYTPKQYDIRASEKCKIRMMDPPVEYDDKGFLKKWTVKELTAMRGNTKLPGYPATLETIRVNQMVQVYLVPAPRVKEDPKKKKRVDDDPPPRELPEAVVIVIQPAPLLK